MSLSRDDLETLKLAATEGAACQATLWQAVRILAARAIEGEPEIEELKVTDAYGATHYVYTAKINGKLTDLAPYGNRLPSA